MFRIVFRDMEFRVKLFEMTDFLSGVYFPFSLYCDTVDSSKNFTAYNEILEDMLDYFVSVSKDFSKVIVFDYFNQGDWKHSLSEETKELISTFTIKLIQD